jgi:hypothetical protein
MIRVEVWAVAVILKCRREREREREERPPRHGRSLMTHDTATHSLARPDTAARSVPRPESIARAVDGSWLDALAEAIAFARRLTNREV